MRTLHTVVCIIVLWLLLTGCGGGNNSLTSGTVQSGGRGSATFTVIWPTRSRLVPLAANSIVVTIYLGTAQLQQKVLPRPAGGGSSSGTFALLPTGSLSATATACPNADGTGVAQAAATVPFVVQANLTTPLSITMNSTIDHLAVSSASVTVYTGASTPVTVTAYDAAGSVVITSAFRWNSTNTAITSVDQSGNITGVAALSTPVTVTVTETESGKSTSVSVTVLQSAPSNPFLYDGFAYQAGSAVSGLNGGTGNWGSAWNEYGQGETASIISPTGLTFSNLVTTWQCYHYYVRPACWSRAWLCCVARQSRESTVHQLSDEAVGRHGRRLSEYLFRPRIRRRTWNRQERRRSILWAVQLRWIGSVLTPRLSGRQPGQTVFIVIRIKFWPRQRGTTQWTLFVNPPHQPATARSAGLHHIRHQYRLSI